jgi:hypothetical protein
VDYLLGPSLKATRLVIAFVAFISVLSIISLLMRKFDLSVTFANILMLLVIVPVVFDWLILPTGLDLSSSLFWEVIKVLIAAVLGTVLDRVVRKRT